MILYILVTTIRYYSKRNFESREWWTEWEKLTPSNSNNWNLVFKEKKPHNDKNTIVSSRNTLYEEWGVSIYTGPPRFSCWSPVVKAVYPELQWISRKYQYCQYILQFLPSHIIVRIFRHKTGLIVHQRLDSMSSQLFLIYSQLPESIMTDIVCDDNHVLLHNIITAFHSMF